jgi:hypothetical protein
MNQWSIENGVYDVPKNSWAEAGKLCLDWGTGRGKSRKCRDLTVVSA